MTDIGQRMRQARGTVRICEGLAAEEVTLPRDPHGSFDAARVLNRVLAVQVRYGWWRPCEATRVGDGSVQTGWVVDGPLAGEVRVFWRRETDNWYLDYSESPSPLISVYRPDGTWEIDVSIVEDER